MPGFYVLPEVGDEVLVAFSNPGWRPQNLASSASSIAAQIRSRYPNGADFLVIVPSTTAGWSSTSNSKGIIAILIGLLLPAVQKMRELPSPARSKSPDALALRAALKPGGKFGLATPRASKNELLIETLE